MFIKSIAFTTAISIFGAQPTALAAGVSTAALIHEEHFSEQGIEIDLYVTRDADGIVLSEARLLDPERRGTEVDVWTDGVTVWWDGTVDGERVFGSAPAVDFGDPQEAAFCFTPVTAIICLGALALMASTSDGCAHGKSICRADPTSEIPDGGGGVPGDGGGGDGESGGDAGGDGGDDD